MTKTDIRAPKSLRSTRMEAMTKSDIRVPRSSMRSTRIEAMTKTDIRAPKSSMLSTRIQAMPCQPFSATKTKAPSSSAVSSRTSRSKLGAILCPIACALVLVCIFAVSFLGSRIAYDQYDRYCASRRFNPAKLRYVFPNSTLKLRPMLL